MLKVATGAPVTALMFHERQPRFQALQFRDGNEDLIARWLAERGINAEIRWQVGSRVVYIAILGDESHDPRRVVADQWIVIAPNRAVEVLDDYEMNSRYQLA